MELWHLYYFLTTIIALAIPGFICIKTKEWMTFAVFFPFFYTLYSFVGPLGVILGSNSTFYRPLHEKIFNVSDSIPLYIAHTYFLIFLFSWLAGFYLKSQREYLPKRILVCRNLIGTNIIRLLLSVTSIVFGCIYLFGIHDLLIYAIASNISAYKVISLTPISSLIRASYSLWGSCIISLSAIVFGSFKSRGITKYKIVLLANIGVYFLLAFVTGDRGQLFIVLIAIIISFNLVVKRSKLLSLRFILIVCLLLIIGTIIKDTRGIGIYEVIHNPLMVTKYVNKEAFLRTILSSGENIAPYLSMFFLVSHDVPLLWGKSFLYLIISFVPRFIAPWRPPSYTYHVAYIHYANLEGLKRGICFHQAADWYFNFSVTGLFIGGFFIGYIMAKLENKVNSLNKIGSYFYVTIYASLCGWIPQLIRSPIEGYKAFIYEYALIPFFFFVLLPHINKLVCTKRPN